MDLHQITQDRYVFRRRCHMRETISNADANRVVEVSLMPPALSCQDRRSPRLFFGGPDSVTYGSLSAALFVPSMETP